MKKITLTLFLILGHLSFAQKISEFQLYDWEKNSSFYYSQIPKSSLILKKDLKKYFVFTTNLLVNDQVGNLIDTLRSKTNLNSVFKKSQTKFSLRDKDNFIDSFSDSLNQPVVLRTISSHQSCDTCSNSIIEILIEDSTIREILLKKNLRKFSLSYYQMTLNRKWQSSFITLCYKSSWRTKYIWIELPDDTKFDSGQ